jgi:hypothetical protein
MRTDPAPGSRLLRPPTQGPNSGRYRGQETQHDSVPPGPPTSRRVASAMSQLLTPFLRETWTGLRPANKLFDPSGTMRRYAMDAAKGVGLDASNVYAVQMRMFKDLYLSMPVSMRDEAATGFTCALDGGTTRTVCKELERLTGRALDRAAVAGMPEKPLLDGIVEKIDNSAGGLLPPSVLDTVPDLLLFANYARMRGDERLQTMLFPFVQLLEKGHLVIGLTKESILLVVTL